MKYMRKEWKRIIPKKASDLKTEERVGKWFGVREKCLGMWEVKKDREIEEKWEKCRADPIYRNLSFSMDQEMSRAVENEKARNSYRAAIERCPQQINFDGLRSYQASIKHTKTSSMDWVAVKKLSRQILKNFDG